MRLTRAGRHFMSSPRHVIAAVSDIMPLSDDAFRSALFNENIQTGVNTWTPENGHGESYRLG